MLLGARSDLPWAIRFPKESPAWSHHVHDFGLSRDALWSYPVHPTQVYESLVGVLLFGLLLVLRKYRKFSGQVFLGWVLGYGILRPIIEIFRDDDDRGLYSLLGHQLSTSQIIGIDLSQGYDMSKTGLYTVKVTGGVQDVIQDETQPPRPRDRFQSVGLVCNELTLDVKKGTAVKINY